MTLDFEFFKALFVTELLQCKLKKSWQKVKRIMFVFYMYHICIILMEFSIKVCYYTVHIYTSTCTCVCSCTLYNGHERERACTCTCILWYRPKTHVLMQTTM